ncbi:uncharacterized protein B0I36DRAFT_363316 [Microdochium trichocladiopsis]|uniref:Uncharacterized protein n=1 Tax=Microdochium trichocladiopsis TaxID=1682393 RepID=A0A9P9BRA2_9PEZI|nr:uncharacterized protein B0I36DRAFT_363316 [Microdochium trichocladiopsis]KAH7031655.1 hypothetical protein B0I36DRAFT_363316 [Microdochium trichocladiopsis]
MPRGTELTYRSVHSEAPIAFLFYAVARAGPNGEYLPMAIFQSYPKTGDLISIQQAGLLRACQRVLQSLASASNTSTLQAEVAIATRFYSRAKHPPYERVQVPSPLTLDPPDDDTAADFLRPVPEGGLEFPCTSRCLLSALRFDPEDGEQYRLRSWPLGAGNSHHNLVQGLVVFDITECGRPRYGIYAFRAFWMGWVDDSSESGWDPVEDEPPVNKSRAMLGKQTADVRVPLSGRGYLDKLHRQSWPRSVELVIDWLDEIPLIDASVTKAIWSLEQEDDGTNSDPVDSLTVQPINYTPRNLKDMAIDSLLANVSSMGHFHTDTFATIQQLPDFQARLLARMRASPHSLGPSSASGQLLYLAYRGEPELDWASYDISMEELQLALARTELENAMTLSICFGTLHTTPEQFLEVILSAPATKAGNLSHLRILEGPGRPDNNASIRFLQLLLGSARTSDHAWRLLKSPRLLLSGLLAIPMHRQLLFLPRLPVEIFPVRHVLVKYQLEGQEHYYTHLPLYDAPLHAMGIVKGLQRFISITFDRRHHDNCDYNYYYTPPSPSVIWSIENLFVPIMPEAEDRPSVDADPHMVTKDNKPLQPKRVPGDTHDAPPQIYPRRNRAMVLSEFWTLKKLWDS